MDMDITDLHGACSTGDNEKVKAILRTGLVNINDAWCGNETPLMVAMKDDKPDIVRTLLAEESIELGRCSTYGETALHLACMSNSASVIPVFCQDRRCCENILNKKNYAGFTALMIAVNKGYIDCVQQLGKMEGIDFVSQDKMGFTVMQVAKMNKDKHSALLDYLVERNKRVLSIQNLETMLHLTLQNMLRRSRM